MILCIDPGGSEIDLLQQYGLGIELTENKGIQMCDCSETKEIKL